MNLVSRMTNITLRPKTEWPVIAAESETVGSLFSKFIIVMAAIGPVCTAINSLVFGHSLPFTDVSWRPSIGSVIAGLVVTYVLTLLGVAVTAFIVEKLAPTFQSSGDLPQALKLVAYSQAPLWAAGVLNLIPFLGILTIFVGLYGLYLAYIGLPVVMKTPENKVIPYLLVVILVSIVLWVVFGLISAAVIGTGAMMTGAMGH